MNDDASVTITLTAKQCKVVSAALEHLARQIDSYGIFAGATAATRTLAPSGNIRAIKGRFDAAIKGGE